MKIIIITLIIIIGNLSFTQTLSQQQKDSIINNLNNPRWAVRSQAVLDIYQQNIPEALPVLENKIFEQEKDIAFFYLLSINKYNSANILNITNKFIDTVAYLKDYLLAEDIFELKAQAIRILFDRGDYSRTPIIFEYIETKKPGVAIIPFDLLSDVIKFVPQYKDQAEAEFRRIMLSVNDDYYSSISLIKLAKNSGDEFVPDLLNVMKNSNNSTLKNLAYSELEKRNYGGMEELTKQQFISDSIRAESMLIKLLTKYNSPATYKFILDNYKNVLDQNDIEFYTYSFNSVRKNASLLPPSLNNLFEQLDYFKNLCDTLVIYTWLGDISFSNELKNILTIAKTNLQNGDSLSCRVQVKAFQDLVDNVYKDSLNTDPRFVTIEGWKFLYWNAQYILDRLPEPPANPNLVVKLKNSLGNQIPASNVTYYENSWKDAVNNGDGTFTVITTKPTVSIRVYYEYASLQADNVTAQNNTYTFQTVNAAVQLKNSLGNLIDAGTVQYYAGAWRNFGTTSNGVANKELLPINYSFRMTYEYGSIDKQQNLSTDPTVVFQTVNAAVQLKNSLGSFIDEGTVQYYAGAWRSFGTTSNGVAYKELLPINYSIRMTYEYVSKDKQQNLSTNPVVDFSTMLCSVKVSKTSNNQPISNAAVKYYAGAWRNLGTTNSVGITTKELLPANISFRATSGSVSLDKQQDISVNSLVEILLNIP